MRFSRTLALTALCAGVLAFFIGTKSLQAGDPPWLADGIDVGDFSDAFEGLSPEGLSSAAQEVISGAGGEDEDGSPSEMYAGGGISLDFVLHDLDWDTFVGFGVFGQGLYTLELLPGKSYPFPAVIAVDFEFIYFAAEDGISDVILAAHGTFGVDLLHRMESIILYPYVGVGLGFELVSGEKDWGYGITEDADENRFIFPFELGLGFVYRFSPTMALYARTGFSLPGGAANVSSFWRLQAGLLFAF